MSSTISPHTHLAARDAEDPEVPAAVGPRSIASPQLPIRIEMLEETAYDLAVLAGEQLIEALGRRISVRYKDRQRGIMAPHDAVSDVDEAIEDLVRRRLAARYPDHAVLGEEAGLDGAPNASFTWTIDPIDGTTNFVNGLPCYASAIGVVFEGQPVAGAVWCSATHALRPGVYHARRGGLLRFDGVAVPAAGIREVTGRQRRVSTAPAPHPLREPESDHRHLGAIALESALVAAGALVYARAARPRAWDVAPGIVLTEAAGHEVWTQRDGRWERFKAFDDLATWAQPILFADRQAVPALQLRTLAL